MKNRIKLLNKKIPKLPTYFGGVVHTWSLDLYSQLNVWWPAKNTNRYWNNMQAKNLKLTNRRKGSTKFCFFLHVWWQLELSRHWKTEVDSLFSTLGFDIRNVLSRLRMIWTLIQVFFLPIVCGSWENSENQFLPAPPPENQNFDTS